MKRHGFKRALLGYSKRDVCEYIAEKDQQYTQALTEKNTALEKTVINLNRQIAELQQENDNLRYRIHSVFGNIPDRGNPEEEMSEALETEQQRSMEAIRGFKQEQLEKLHLYENRFKEAHREWREIMVAFTEYFEGEILMIDEMEKELSEMDDNL